MGWIEVLYVIGMLISGCCYWLEVFVWGCCLMEEYEI